MNWKFWKKTDKYKNTSPSTKNMALIIELSPNGDLFPTAYFPRLPDHLLQEGANNFAIMVSLLHSGQLLAVLQKAIVKGGAIANLEGFSGAILNKLNELVSELELEDDSDIVVHPTNVFSSPKIGMNET